MVHHAGKDAGQGPRGSSALHGATDSEIEVIPGKARVKKQRDMEFAPPIHFKIEPVIIEDKAGNTKSTAIIVPDQAPDKKPLNAAGQKGLTSLQKVIENYNVDAGETAADAFDGGEKTVDLEAWRFQFLQDHYAGKSNSTASSAFSRAKENMLENRWILIAAEKVTLQ